MTDGSDWAARLQRIAADLAEYSREQEEDEAAPDFAEEEEPEEDVDVWER